MPRLRTRRIGRLRHVALVVLIALAGWMSGADLAWAKPPKAQAPDKPVKSYVLPYAVVLLGVALGMILVLRPVKRDDEPKRNDTVE